MKTSESCKYRGSRKRQQLQCILIWFVFSYGPFLIIWYLMHTFSYVFICVINIFNRQISSPTGGLGLGNKTRWLGLGLARSCRKENDYMISYRTQIGVVLSRKTVSTITFPPNSSALLFIWYSRNSPWGQPEWCHCS